VANLYLHYVLDLWAERWRRREAAGDLIIARYADDFIVGVEHESDARRVLDEMRERLQEFALSLHSEKTRLIEFGRFAAANRKRRGLGKPETFHLPGLHLYLQQNSPAQIPNQTEVPAGPHAGKFASHQTGIATEYASAVSPAGKMVAAGRHQLLQLPRGADKRSDTDRVSLPRHQSLAAHATAAEPERLDDLGGDQAVGRRLAPATANPSPVAREALRR
jgi:RNA-directed DNA polymerase